MSIKSEREAFNWKAFLLTLGICVLVFGSVHIILTYFNPEQEKDAVWYWNRVYWILIYPAIITSFMLSNFSQSKLTITAFNNITDFENKLLKRVEQFKVSRLNTTENNFVFYPTSKFKKLFSYWFNAERIEMRIEENAIVLIGPVYRISQVEDTLTWNKDFKQ
ncbi:MAG: hypothetical protein EBR30_04600 [Cytophagia bacterium]|nr:hypothetical protein [Cytophagia bacterium]